MAEIKTAIRSLPKEEIHLHLEGNDLDMETARAAAKHKAREINPDAMMLSWHSGKTGKYWPVYDCGAGGHQPWVLYAESRGCNLVIVVNNGEYTFYFLKL